MDSIFGKMKYQWDARWPASYDGHCAKGRHNVSDRMARKKWLKEISTQYITPSISPSISHLPGQVPGGGMEGRTKHATTMEHYQDIPTEGEDRPRPSQTHHSNGKYEDGVQG